MNYFEELSKKGVINTEMNIEELLKLSIEDKITQDQFIKILIDNLGKEKFYKIWNDFLLENHFQELYESYPPKE